MKKRLSSEKNSHHVNAKLTIGCWCQDHHGEGRKRFQQRPYSYIIACIVVGHFRLSWLKWEHYFEETDVCSEKWLQFSTGK